jgi:arylsulfatase A-like enzyme
MPAQNILFILTDQWPSWAFSYMSADIPTPNIDRLAAQGTVFTNAFTTCPLCTPARGTLLTSRWPHQTGVYDNYNVGYSQQTSLSIDEQTWIEQAVQQGYHVGYFGKWHLGSNDPASRAAHRYNPYRPDRAGQKKQPYSYESMAEYYTRQEQPQLMKGRAPFWGEVNVQKAAISPFPVMVSGVQFLEEWASRDRKKPFFLTVSSAPPHFPHYLPAEYAGIADNLRDSTMLPTSIEDNCFNRPWFHAASWWPSMDTSVLDLEEWRTLIAYSHAHIMLVDEAIGLVLDALDRLKLTESTVIVFTADHGDMEGAHNRFDKGAYFYEEVWRIPLVICLPNLIPASKNTFVSLIDVGETLFSLVGAGEKPGYPRSGRNLLPLINNSEKLDAWPDVAYGVYDLYNGINFAVRAIRNKQFKYVWNPQAMDEFYDLDSDPYEMVNRIDDPEVLKIKLQLQDELLVWLNAISDNLPERVATLPPAGTIMATGKMGP